MTDHPAPEHQMTGNQQRSAVLAVLVSGVCLLLWSRFSAYQPVGLCLDDWAFVQIAESFSSLSEAFKASVTHPHRPIDALAIMAVFRHVRAYPMFIPVLAFAGYGLLALVYGQLTWLLSGNRRVVFLSLIFLAAAPIPVHSFHWPTMVVGESLLVFYLLSLLCWVLYSRGASAWLLVAASFCYLLGLMSYEVGAFLPLCMLFLKGRRQLKRFVLWCLTFGSAGSIYLLWRFSNVFGQGYNVLYSSSHFGVEVSLWLIGHNVLKIAEWWVGSEFLSLMLRGWRGLRLLEPRLVIFLVVWNALMVTLLAAIMLKSRDTLKDEEQHETERPRMVSIALMGLFWTVCTYMPFLLWPVAGRHHLLSVMGMGLFFAVLLIRCPRRVVGVVAGLGLLVGLLTNQGTAAAWKCAGQLQSELYEALENASEPLRGSDVVVIDTQSLRKNLTALDPVAGHDDVTRLLNAGLIRGYVPRAMLQLINDGAAASRVLLDVEYGTRTNSDWLIWHDRYNPSSVHTTSLDKVFIVPFPTLDIAPETLPAGSEEGDK